MDVSPPRFPAKAGFRFYGKNSLILIIISLNSFSFIVSTKRKSLFVLISRICESMTKEPLDFNL